MIRPTQPTLLVVALLASVGCNDGSGDPGGTGGVGGTGGTGMTASVTGDVFWYNPDAPGFEPIAGATIQVEGTPISATSEMNGDYMLEAPLGPGAIYATADGYWGDRELVDVPTEGLSSVRLEMLTNAEIAEMADEVGQTIDSSKGLVILFFDEEVATGGESADLGVGYDYSIIYDASDNGVLGNELIAGGFGGVVFANVDVSANVMPVATDADGEPCTLEPVAVYASHAKVLTEIEVVCP